MRIIRHGLSFEEESADMTGKGFSVAKELIENLFFGMAKLSTKYDNEVFSDLPYTYSERPLDSILLPILSKLCNSMVMVEVPTVRVCDNRRFQVEKSTGRIDYWCIYKGYSFVIELKHSFDCFTTTKTRYRKVIQPWIKMNEQLQSIEQNLKSYDEATMGVIRIGLHIVTSYSDKTPNRNLVDEFLESIPDTFERFQNDLGKRYPSLKPNMLICWKIPKKLILKDIYTFPGLWAIAKIYPIIKHRGAID